ncbi:DUF3515 family protein [Microbacterium sp. P03]|uniref:DUF3515 family protein n=1 Tax=Microbacterium sp. P03 TaxID=3366946 RepID=UPI00374656E1
MRRFVRPLAAALVLLASLSVSGCAATVSLQPAASANDPACADVSVRLPATVGGEARRWTDAQATGAWGDPAAVILTCGLAPPGPSTLPCQTVGGVDWLIDDADAPKYRFTTFGRSPAVEVYLDYDVVGGADTLSELSSAVSTLPTDGSVCTARPTS